MSPAIVQDIGPTELLIVLAIVLLVFGPKRLPQLGRQLGGGIREFKDSLTGRSKDDKDQEEDDGKRVSAALGRPEGEAEAESVEGEVVPERR